MKRKLILYAVYGVLITTAYLLLPPMQIISKHYLGTLFLLWAGMVLGSI